MAIDMEKFLKMLDEQRIIWHDVEEKLKNEVYAAELRAEANTRVTTIKIHEQTKRALQSAAAYPKESYEGIIIRLLNCAST